MYIIMTRKSRSKKISPDRVLEIEEGENKHQKTRKREETNTIEAKK